MVKEKTAVRPYKMQQFSALSGPLKKRMLRRIITKHMSVQQKNRLA